MNPGSSSINMFWFQLRQNDVLDNFKENIKTEADFEHCQYYTEEGEDKMTEKKEEKSSLIKSVGKTAQIRSQSVTQK